MRRQSIYRKVGYLNRAKKKAQGYGTTLNLRGARRGQRVRERRVGNAQSISARRKGATKHVKGKKPNKENSDSLSIKINDKFRVRRGNANKIKEEGEKRPNESENFGGKEKGRGGHREPWGSEKKGGKGGVRDMYRGKKRESGEKRGEGSYQKRASVGEGSGR